MFLIPPEFKSHLSIAKKYRDLGACQEVTFSGPTYQVKIVDPHSHEEFWTFLSFDDLNKFQDAFCSCPNQGENSCWHQALSYLALINEKGVPLHLRFQNSFWKVLGEVWFRRKTAGLKHTSKTEKGSTFLKGLSLKKPLENEENSIKFSNLSEEELDLFKAGKPSEALRLELSPFMDFAKLLFLYSESEDLEVIFSEPLDSLLIHSIDFEIRSPLQSEELKALIPTLNSVHSNLKVFNTLKDLYKNIDYDPLSKEFHLTPRGPLKQKGVPFYDYLYLKGSGFYPASPILASEIQGDEMEPFLDRYQEDLHKYISQKSIAVSHHLEFDPDWNLQIDPYIHEKGDLNDPLVSTWGHWTFVPKMGFFRADPNEMLPKYIPEKELAGFIRDNTSFLNEQEGFLVHLGSLDAQVIFRVDPAGNLFFEKRAGRQGGETHEFGQWVYSKGEGFFHKTSQGFHLPFSFEMVREELVAHFIRQHRSELELVQGFITEGSPFQKVYLEARLEPKERICLEPHYILKEEYLQSRYRIYEDWVFIEGMGFSELPPSQRLPENVKSPLWIRPDEVEEFLEKKIHSLEPFLDVVDSRLVAPKSIALVLNSIEETQSHRFSLALSYETERGTVPIDVLLKGFRKKKRFIFTEAGRFDLTEGRFQWLKRYLHHEGPLQVSTIDILRLHAYEEILARGEALHLLQEVLELKKVPPFNIDELQSTLWPYQENGVKWLFSLFNYLLGGLLCDEMGLGKTHQAMGLIAASRHLRKEAKFLVVCPTSVLYHWEDRLKEFFPALKVEKYHGPFRLREEKFEADLLLTSYGVLRSDIESFKKIPFDVAFYDEIQVAKNHRSKLYAALAKVKADVKIGLTGTPIENRLRELKSLFDLVLPGYMPQESDYAKLIVRPIERMRDVKQKSFLRRLTNPFILRRKKADVLLDLPSKVEEISRCDLAPSQAHLYREVLVLQREVLLKDLLDEKKAVPFLHVFSLLSRLKQICDHPALYLKTPEEYKKYHSGKWELFCELLLEARESGQKVVVYSQYLGMLDIIEQYLKEEGIAFASLRGTTRDRKGQMELFAKDPNCLVFVASLKAAGLGIDLTSASVVIHYDRWWNAARENQATDRVHRIGQSRGVQVFKLVTKNTFEERIHEIIERKKELMEESIGTDDQELIKAFTREELYQLLQFQEN